MREVAITSGVLARQKISRNPVIAAKILLGSLFAVFGICIVLQNVGTCVLLKERGQRERRMNKSDIVKGLANREGLSVRKADDLVNNVFELIGLCLACGEDVNLSGFGKFEVRNKGAVVRKHPRTGEEIAVPPKVSLGFKPSPCLKERMNG